mgnify:CR=1 FL=1
MLDTGRAKNGKRSILCRIKKDMVKIWVRRNPQRSAKQIKGPARGVFQMEPFTAIDICTNYLKYRESLMKKVAEVCMLDWKYFLKPNEDDWQNILTSNLLAQVCMTRMHYRRVPKPLPRTLEDQAIYWKSFYNTHKGKGTPQHFAEIVSKYG